LHTASQSIQRNPRCGEFVRQYPPIRPTPETTNDVCLGRGGAGRKRECVIARSAELSTAAMPSTLQHNNSLITLIRLVLWPDVDGKSHRGLVADKGPSNSEVVQYRRFLILVIITVSRGALPALSIGFCNLSQAICKVFTLFKSYHAFHHRLKIFHSGGYG
jgi:hypothetical protein